MSSSIIESLDSSKSLSSVSDDTLNNSSNLLLSVTEGLCSLIKQLLALIALEFMVH